MSDLFPEFKNLIDIDLSYIINMDDIFMICDKTDKMKCIIANCYKPKKRDNLCYTHLQIQKYKNNKKITKSKMCIIKNCTETKKYNDLCDHHFSRDLLHNPERMPFNKTLCRYPDCTSAHVKRHMCHLHNIQHYKHIICIKKDCILKKIKGHDECYKHIYPICSIPGCKRRRLKNSTEELCCKCYNDYNSII